MSCEIEAPLNWAMIMIGSYEDPAENTIAEPSMVDIVNLDGSKSIATTYSYSLLTQVFAESEHVQISIHLDPVACDHDKVYFCGVAMDGKIFTYVNKPIYVASPSKCYYYYFHDIKIQNTIFLIHVILSSLPDEHEYCTVKDEKIQPICRS